MKPFPQEFQHGHGDVHQQLSLWGFSSLVPKDPYSQQSNVIVIIPFAQISSSESMILCNSIEAANTLSRLFSVFGKLVGPLLSSRVRENIVYHRCSQLSFGFFFLVCFFYLLRSCLRQNIELHAGVFQQPNAKKYHNMRRVYGNHSIND